jgi:hypothetical protein
MSDAEWAALPPYHGPWWCVPALQIFSRDISELPWPNGTDLLQVVWCPRSHEPDGHPAPLLRWRHSSEITDILTDPPVPPDEQINPWYVPRPCILHPEPITEYPSWYDLNAEERVPLPDPTKNTWVPEGPNGSMVLQASPLNYFDVAYTLGTKVGGWPFWLQYADWPVCGCGATMMHLLTIASREPSNDLWFPIEDMKSGGPPREGDYLDPALGRPTDLVLGDMGWLYLFTCPHSPAHTLETRMQYG